MGISVGVNPPKTPVTEGSHGVAQNTIPNVCKMPGPPAPFVPTPLPNIAKSELSPKDYSTTVKIEGSAVAIRGATFESIGDIASKGTGGGLISANCQGPAKFITPGSMDVKIEGKAVQQLGEPMLNNLGPGGSPPNTGATMEGENQGDSEKPTYPSGIDCEKNKQEKGWDDCDVAQLCAKAKEINKRNKKQDLYSDTGQTTSDALARRTKSQWMGCFARAVPQRTSMSEAFLKQAFYHPCAKEKWEKGPPKRNPKPANMQADHIHDCQLGCNMSDITNFKWLSSSVNGSAGSSFSGFDPDLHPGGITLPGCNCP